MSEVGFEPVYSYMTAQCINHLAITQYDSNRSLKYINITDAECNPNGKATMSLFTKYTAKQFYFLQHYINRPNILRLYIELSQHLAVTEL